MESYHRDQSSPYLSDCALVRSVTPQHWKRHSRSAKMLRPFVPQKRIAEPAPGLHDNTDVSISINEVSASIQDVILVWEEHNVANITISQLDYKHIKKTSIMNHFHHAKKEYDTFIDHQYRSLPSGENESPYSLHLNRLMKILVTLQHK